MVTRRSAVYHVDSGAVAKGLSRDVLAATALEIVDGEGLAQLSMRRLAARLGVDPMAAYRHLPNKEALLDAVVDAVLREVTVPARAADTAPQEQLRAVAQAILTTIAAHPHAAPLLAERAWTTPAGYALTETILEVAEDLGTPPDVALAVNATGLLLVALGLAVHGAATRPGLERFANLDPAAHPRLAAMVTRGTGIVRYDDVLDFWLDAVTRELTRRTESTAPQRSPDRSP